MSSLWWCLATAAEQAEWMAVIQFSSSVWLVVCGGGGRGNRHLLGYRSEHFPTGQSQMELILSFHITMRRMREEHLCICSPASAHPAGGQEAVSNVR